MDAKKFLLAFLGAAVVMLAVSTVWYMVIMEGFYSENFSEIQRAEFDMVWITIGYVFAALMLSFIYPKGYQGGGPLGEGLKFGLFMGLLIAVPVGFVNHGVWKIALSGTIVEIVYQIVEKSLAGIVIGLIYGRGGK